jgi:hypothetical protein
MHWVFSDKNLSEEFLVSSIIAAEVVAAAVPKFIEEVAGRQESTFACPSCA